jgi:hypothetical protein
MSKTNAVSSPRNLLSYFISSKVPVGNERPLYNSVMNVRYFESRIQIANWRALWKVRRLCGETCFFVDAAILEDRCLL